MSRAGKPRRVGAPAALGRRWRGRLGVAPPADREADDDADDDEGDADLPAHPPSSSSHVGPPEVGSHLRRSARVGEGPARCSAGEWISAREAPDEEGLASAFEQAY